MYISILHLNASAFYAQVSIRKFVYSYFLFRLWSFSRRKRTAYRYDCVPLRYVRPILTGPDLLGETPLLELIHYSLLCITFTYQINNTIRNTASGTQCNAMNR